MIDGIPLSVLTPSALLGIGVLLILTGKLIPRRTYDDKVHEADEWRTESRIKDQQLAERDLQLREKDLQLRHLSEVGKTVDQIMRAIGTRTGSDR